MKKIVTSILVIIFAQQIYSQTQDNNIFQKLGNSIFELKLKSANVLFPEKFNSATTLFLEAQQISFENGDRQDILENLKQADNEIGFIENNISKNYEAYGDILLIRNKAIEAQSHKFAGRFWNNAENMLSESVDDFNSGDVEDAIATFPQIKKEYNSAFKYSQKANMLILNWMPLINANNSFANVFAAEEYNIAFGKLNETLDLINDGEDETVIDKLKDASADEFRKASVIAKAFIEKYPRVLEARKNAKLAKSTIYSIENWEAAEKLASESSSTLKENSYEESFDLAQESIDKYNAAKNEAIQTQLLYLARKQINIADAINTENNAPKTFESGKIKLAMLKNLIKTDGNYDEIIETAKIATLKLYEANQISGLINKIDDNEITWEDLLIQHNIVVDSKSNADYDRAYPDKSAYLFEAMKKLSEAENEEAAKYAPKTFKIAQDILQHASDLLSKTDFNKTEVITLAANSISKSQKAIKISQLAKSVSLNSSTKEDAILNWEMINANDGSLVMMLDRIIMNKNVSTKKQMNEEVLISDIFTADEAEILNANSPVIIRLINLGFTPMSSVIIDKDKVVLNKLINVIEDYPDSKIKIICHTDNLGLENLNEQLSKLRADAIKKFIIQNSGISEERIHTIGKGGKEPIADNDSFEGRQQNRRVEVTIYY